MQATMTSNAQASPRRLQFARRGYMVRSEKRPSSAPRQSSGQQGGDRPPRRRPNRAGFPYKLLTVILLILFWPVGMILLWRRKLRWNALMKLFTSAITLMLCVILLGTALTVQTRNPSITAVQNRVISAFDTTLDAVTDFSVRMGERAELSMEALHDIFEVYEDQALMKTADFIDWGVKKAQIVRTSFSGADETAPDAKSGEDKETGAAVESTPAPGASEAPGASAGAESEVAPEGTGAAEAAATANAPAEPKQPAATNVPAKELFVGAEDEELPVYIPAEAPELSGGIELSAGLLQRTGIFQPGAASALEKPAGTPEPAPEISEFAVKPAGEAVIYFNAGSGKYYHTHSSCGSMKTAKEYRFAEIVDYKQKPCSNCNAPDRSLLEEEYIVWVDEDGLAHLSDECAAFKGDWSLESAAAAIEAGREGCPDCLADLYLEAIEAGRPITLAGAATSEPEETAEPEVTEEPEETAEAEETPEPENSAEPEETEEAEESAAPEETPEPEDSAASEASIEPEDAAGSEASAEPENSAAPEETPEPEDADASTAPIASASATKAPIIVTPRTTLKPVPEAMVYHTSNGTYYHTNDHCSGMTGGKLYTLSQSVADGFKQCPVCGAPPADANSSTAMTLWLDEQNICHVSDECKSFQGEYKLVTREEALEQHLAGCSRCGGADYVMPNTVMDSYVVDQSAASPTAAPEATPEAEAAEDAA